jgi:hypothetical protein
MSGWKTYVVVAIGVIFNGLVGGGYIDESYREIVNAILGFLGLGAIRHGVSTEIKK